MLDEIKPLIVNLRRQHDVEGWAAFSELIERDIERVCSELSTRWLVSVCDTYADYGNAIEARNAMFVSLLVNLEKTSQSYVRWRLDYPDSLAVPADIEPQKIRLWDGMTSFHLVIGDVTNFFFGRLQRLLEPTPHIAKILRTVLERIKENDTILGTLNQYHRNVFEPDDLWTANPRYDPWRESGELGATPKTQREGL